MIGCMRGRKQKPAPKKIRQSRWGTADFFAFAV